MVTLNSYEGLAVAEPPDSYLEFFLAFKKVFNLMTTEESIVGGCYVPPVRCGDFDYIISSQCIAQMFRGNKFGRNAREKARRLAGVKKI